MKALDILYLFWRAQQKGRGIAELEIIRPNEVLKDGIDTDSCRPAARDEGPGGYCTEPLVSGPIWRERIKPQARRTVLRFLLVSIVWASLAILTGCGDKSSALPDAGTWRVVNYWAIWCAPCREEIPELNALHQDSPLTVFAVNYDGQQGETLTQQAAELGIRFELLEQDPGPELGIERPRVLPTTLLVNPEGVVTDILIGPQTRENLAAIWESRRS